LRLFALTACGLLQTDLIGVSLFNRVTHIGVIGEENTNRKNRMEIKTKTGNNLLFPVAKRLLFTKLTFLIIAV
jgi:hypothetical protein